MFLYIILCRDDSLELNKLGNKLPETVRNYLFKTLFCYKSAVFGLRFFLVDGKGLPTTEFSYHYIEPIPYSMFYAVWQADDMKHFALMVGGEVITPYEIENYGCPCNDAIPLYADGKSGLLAYGCGIVYVKPEYDEVYDEGFDSDFIFVKDSKKGGITLEDHRYITDEEFFSLSEDEQDALHDAGFVCSYDDC